ncbi:unnamed protein product, partial [Heterosigma akashiwo]
MGGGPCRNTTTSSRARSNCCSTISTVLQGLAVEGRATRASDQVWMARARSTLYRGSVTANLNRRRGQLRFAPRSPTRFSVLGAFPSQFTNFRLSNEARKHRSNN